MEAVVQLSEKRRRQGKAVEPIRDRKNIQRMGKILREKKDRHAERNFFLFEMGINTGLRVSDLLQLKVKDVRNKDYIEMWEQKTGKHKKFKIRKSMKEKISKYIEGKSDDQYLFYSERSKDKPRPISRNHAWRILKEAAAEAGIKENIGTHTLRKTYGYWMYKETKDVALLQNLFNHASPAVTLRYIGINQDRMDEANDNFRAFENLWD